MTVEELRAAKKRIFDSFADYRKRDADLENLMRRAHAEIKEGDGVTVHLWSDAHAYTVIKRTPSTITIQRDNATLNPNFKPEWIAGGFAGHCTNQDEQSYTYERNPNGEKITLRFSKKWGRFMYLGKAITIGRDEYYDYNF